MRILGLMVISLIMSSCTIVSIPITIVSNEGTMRGVAKAGTKNVTFRVSNAKTVCRGSFNARSKAQTITMAVQCNDGRKEYATMTFDPDTGQGKIRLSDGSEATIMMGNSTVSVKK